MPCARSPDAADSHSPLPAESREGWEQCAARPPEPPLRPPSWRPRPARSGGWQPITSGPPSDVQFTAAERKPRALKLSDPTGKGAAIITADLGNRSSVSLRARVNAQSCAWPSAACGRCCGPQSANGQIQQAGVVRTRKGLRWALWRTTPGGKRVGMVVSAVRLPAKAWRTVTFHSTWSNRRARSYLG